jgi:hypothetical protein
LDQRTNVRRGSVHQTRCYVGVDFVDPPVEFVRPARSHGADRIDAHALALTTSRAILFDDDVDGSFAPV